MPGLQLPIGITISAAGVETFGRIQAAMAAVGGTAQQKAATGLKVVSRSLLEAATTAGQATPSFTSLVDSMSRASKDPQVLAGQLRGYKDALDATIVSLAEGAAGVDGLSHTTSGLKAAFAAMSPVQRKFVEIMAGSSDAIGVMRRAIGTEADLAKFQIDPTKGALSQMASIMRQEWGGAADSVDVASQAVSNMGKATSTAMPEAAANVGKVSHAAAHMGETMATAGGEAAVSADRVAQATVHMGEAAITSTDFTRQLRAAVASGVTVQSQMAIGLRVLTDGLLQASSAANIVSPSMKLLAMTLNSVAASGQATPATLGCVAHAMEKMRASTIKNILAFKGLDAASLSHKDALSLLTAEEKAFIGILATGSKALVTWSNKLRRASKTSARAAQATTGAAQSAKEATGAITGSAQATAGATRVTKGATKATKGLSVTSRRTSGIMGIFSSSMQGLMLVFSALSGSIKGVLFSLIFLGYGVWPITLAVAALGITFAGITKAIVTTGRSMEQLRLKLDLLTGSLEQGYAAWRQTLYWSVRTGRSNEEVAETFRVLRDNGLLFEGAIESAFTLAAARGITAAEAANLYATAIGEEQENLESLRSVGVRVNRDLVDTTKRRAVGDAADLAILERYPGAYQRLAQTGTGALDRIKAAASSAWALIAEPIWEQVFVPLLNSLADASRALIDFVDHARQSKSVTDSWTKTLAVAHNLVGDLNTVFKEHSNLLSLVVENAILVVLGAVRGMIVVGQILLGVLLGLGKAFISLARTLKPVWDSLRLLVSALKETGFLESLTEAKQWNMEFPNIIWTGLAAAMAVLALGKAGLVILLVSLLGDLIISMLPFEDEVRDSMHRIWDWMVIGGAIGLFFGAGGVAIGLGAGLLLGLLDEAMGNPVRTWLEANLPHIFHWLIIGGAIGAFFGAGGVAIGIGAGLLVGWLDSQFDYKVTSWLVEHLPHIFAPALLFGVIGFFLGGGPVGAAIGVATGVFLGWLGASFEIPVMEWLADRLPKIFSPVLLGGIIGLFFSPAGAIIGMAIGGIIGALWGFFPEIQAWGREMKNSLNRIIEDLLTWGITVLGPLAELFGVQDLLGDALKSVRQSIADFEAGLAQDISGGGGGGGFGVIGEGVSRSMDKSTSAMREAMAEYQAEYESMMAEFAQGFMPAVVPAGPVIDLAKSMREMTGQQAEFEALMAKFAPVAMPAGAPATGDLAKTVRERMADYQAEYETMMSGFAGPTTPAMPVPRLAGQAALAAPAQPTIHVDIHGNYILDDAAITRLADQVGGKIMSQLSGRWPVTMR